MAISAPRQQSDFSGFLHAQQAAPIFERAKRTSVVQQLGRQVPLGPSGTEVPVVTGRLTADWVAEAGQKPASEGAMSLKTMTPKKLAVIAVVSEEVVRTNPGGYIEELYAQIGEAFADAFDAAALHGSNSPFGNGNNIDATSKAVGLGTANVAAGGVYADLNAGLALLVGDNKRLNGFAFDDRAEPILNAAVDGQGRPLFTDDTANSSVVGPDGARRARLLGRTAFMGERVGQPTPGGAGTYALGYGGDWTQVAWGQLGGVSYALSREASITIGGTLVNMFQNNLVAIRAETEYGWLVNDSAAFVKYTKTKS